MLKSTTINMMDFRHGNEVPVAVSIDDNGGVHVHYGEAEIWVEVNDRELVAHGYRNQSAPDYATMRVGQDEISFNLESGE